MKRFAGLLCLLALPAVLPERAAADQPRVYTSAAGDRFVMTCNRSGYVLELLQSGDRIYLGASCDAMSPRFGGGRWCASNGGFGLRVGPFEASFPRQEPYCPGVGYSPVYCGC